MNRSDRAKQFMPFDALKGLHEALKIKEYEQERMQKGDLSEEKINKMTQTLISIEKNQTAQVTYYFDGHYKTINGKIKLNADFGEIKVGNVSISLEDVFDITLIK